MKKYRIAALPFLCLLLGLSACNTKEKLMTETEFQAKVDSLTRQKTEAAYRHAQEVLDHRISIEVKEKTDSIVSKRLSAPNR